MARLLVLLTCAAAVGLVLMVWLRAPQRADPLLGISDAELRLATTALAAQRAAMPSQLQGETPAAPAASTAAVPEATPPPASRSTSSGASLANGDEAQLRQRVRERAIEASRQRPLPTMAERASREAWLPPSARATPRVAVVEPVDKERAAAWRLWRSGGKSPHPLVVTPAWRRP